jgi:Lon protease-like protein
VTDPATDRIPLFPLGAVLYPGLLLPLHIFEERYRALVADLVGQPDERGVRFFGVVAIRIGREVGADVFSAGHGHGALHEVGCTAELRSVEAYDDGRFDIVTAGARRFRVLSLDTSLPYLQAEVEWLDEPGGEAADVLAASVLRQFRAYRDALLATRGLVRVDDALPGDAQVLSYLVGATMVLDLADHQSLLAAPDTATRLLLELGLLRRESALLRVLPSLPGVDYARQPASPN